MPLFFILFLLCAIQNRLPLKAFFDFIQIHLYLLKMLFLIGWSFLSKKPFKNYHFPMLASYPSGILLHFQSIPWTKWQAFFLNGLQKEKQLPFSDCIKTRFYKGQKGLKNEGASNWNPRWEFAFDRKKQAFQRFYSTKLLFYTSVYTSKTCMKSLRHWKRKTSSFFIFILCSKNIANPYHIC